MIYLLVVKCMCQFGYFILKYFVFYFYTTLVAEFPRAREFS